MMHDKRLTALVDEMPQIRWLLPLIIAWFIVLFNIERLDIGGKTVLNLSNQIYLLNLLVVLFYLAFPNFSNHKIQYSMVVVTLIYIFVRVGFHSTSKDCPVHLYVIELVTLWGTLFLMYRVSRALLNFELTLSSFVFNPQTTRVASYKRGAALIEEELKRARAYNRPVTLLYCSLYDPQAQSEEDMGKTFPNSRILAEPLIKREYRVKFARLTSLVCYDTDITAEYEEGVLVCLSETSREDAERFLAQLYQLIKLSLPRGLLVGTACFPEDGQTLTQLQETMHGNVHIYRQNNPDDSAIRRPGDVAIETEKRLLIDEKALWVNNLAYQSPGARAIYQPIKRAMDIILVLMVMPLLLPVMAIIAFLIVLDDGFPVFYMQKRTGYNGQRFLMYKFRSMVVGAKADAAQEVVLPNGEKRYLWKKKSGEDKRITRVGHFIRKTSLDEIPQLLNVLKGDMSLVTRPTTWELDKYTLLQTERLTVRPGITGLWQVSARESTNFDERLLWDLKYVEKMGLWLDILILWKTVMQVLKKGGV